MRKKIAVVIGTRPEAIKLLPLYLELIDHSLFQPILISTGQHKEMLEQIFSFFKVRADIEFNIMKPAQSLASASSLLMEHLDIAFKNSTPDLVVVQGDTVTAMIASISAFFNKISVAHVEAGLRSFNKWSPFPEEGNRKIITQIADMHFVPTSGAAENLKRENVNCVYEVGNTVIDALLLGMEKVAESKAVYQKEYSEILSSQRKIVLVTAHRRESFGQGLENVCLALKELAENSSDLIFIFPVHLNPNIKEPVNRILNEIPNIKLMAPVQYDEMIFLLSRSWLVMTDSGGIQEEAPTLNTPFIVLRDVTERPEGIEAGCGILGGTDRKQIVAAFNKIYFNPALHEKMRRAANPYGDGNASKRIISILEKRLRDETS